MYAETFIIYLFKNELYLKLKLNLNPEYKCTYAQCMV